MENERRKNDEILKLKLNDIHKDIESLKKTHSKKFDEILEYNKHQDKLISGVDLLLRGNGKPENGYIVKHEKLFEKVQGICKTLTIHWALLVGVFMLIAGSVIKLIWFMPK